MNPIQYLRNRRLRLEEEATRREIRDKWVSWNINNENMKKALYPFLRNKGEEYIKLYVNERVKYEIANRLTNIQEETQEAFSFANVRDPDPIDTMLEMERSRQTGGTILEGEYNRGR